MANVDRTRLEVLRRRVYPTTGTDVISRGDMLVVSSGNARPASSLTTADAVADVFIGVALHAKPATAAFAATATPDIAVAVDCVAEMDCSGLASVANVGDKVEISIAGGAAEPQVVVVGSSNPIGKVYRKGAVGDTTLMVHLVGGGVDLPKAAD